VSSSEQHFVTSLPSPASPGPVVIPGSAIGMLGGGQLGRMFASVARQFGYQMQVFGEHSSSPAGQLADRSWPATFTDRDQLKEFAERVSVVTLEQENIPVETIQFLEQYVPVHPSAELLRASQHRLLEKTSLRSIGIPTADFLPIRTARELKEGLAEFGGTGILKTVTMGYDGKGQARLAANTDCNAVWSEFAVPEAILEREIEFDFELSVVAGRFMDGSVVCYQPSVNHHVNHILDVSVAPSPLISEQISREASAIAGAILEHFNAYGVLCVEFFLTTSGKLLVNEIAPRPHNSGHLTIDACASSQFEQQLRAVCGMSSGDVQQRRPAAMINLLGEHLQNATPERWQAVFAMSDVHVHMYGKSEARTGRKMGHITATADSAQHAELLARRARAVLMGQ
jgi:5-(carboxyamino)imidazole ribonucleotide synthase